MCTMIVLNFSEARYDKFIPIQLLSFLLHLPQFCLLWIACDILWHMCVFSLECDYFVIISSIYLMYWYIYRCILIFCGEDSLICSYASSPNLLWCSIYCNEIFKIDLKKPVIFDHHHTQTIQNQNLSRTAHVVQVK